MSDAEVAKFQKDALTGHRPTWKMGENPAHDGAAEKAAAADGSEENRARDPHGFFAWRAQQARQESPERRRKLKPEYQNLAGHEIRDLRLAGTEVTAEVRVPRVAYLGDSTIEGLDNCPAMYEAQVLITESSFLSASHRRHKVKKFGHIHLDDIIERRARFQNEVIIAGHFSTRYHSKQVKTLVEKALPDMLDGRLRLWI